MRRRDPGEGARDTLRHRHPVALTVAQRCSATSPLCRTVLVDGRAELARGHGLPRAAQESGEIPDPGAVAQADGLAVVGDRPVLAVEAEDVFLGVAMHRLDPHPARAPLSGSHLVRPLGVKLEGTVVLWLGGTDGRSLGSLRTRTRLRPSGSRRHATRPD